ncbi:MAG: hypothetical protein NC123_19405 [Butyrivibrio sp.]|nr:hypothetical protein [Butyrivibrio sp.]
MFLILSTMTALLECGSIFLGIGLGYSPGRAFSLCLAYQAGNLFPIPFRLRIDALRKVTLLSALLLCVAPFLNIFSSLQWGLYFTGILLLSCAAQSVRAEMKTRIGTVRKRFARIAGFLLAPLPAYIPFPLLLLCCLIVFFSLGRLTDCAKATDIPAPKLHSVCTIMLWHQLHYFIYAYGVLLYAYRITGNPFLTMLFFACTWLTYLSAEPLAKLLQHTFPKSFGTFSGASFYTKMILAGHAVLLLILLLLPNVPYGLFLFLWILTGFGGGTVFAITGLYRHSSSYMKEQLVLTENLGHFMGTGFAVVWTLVFPKCLLQLSYPAAICVLMVLVTTFTAKERHL